MDGPDRGVEPEAWEVHVRAAAMFADREEKVEVPHTASVQVCHDCRGVGRNQCWKCQVRGVACCLGNHDNSVVIFWYTLL